MTKEGKKVAYSKLPKLGCPPDLVCCTVREFIKEADQRSIVSLEKLWRSTGKVGNTLERTSIRCTI